MMFKNAITYLVTPGFRIDSSLLMRRVARSCGETEMRTAGFVVPCDLAADGLVHTVAGHQLICFQTEEKLLPSSVIADAIKERADDIESEQGYKPGRKQMRELKERVVFELLPQAFATKKRTFALLVGEYFIIDTSSAARADYFLETLNKALDVPLSAMRSVRAPASAMTDWLISGDAPDGFTVDRDCELSSPVEEKSTVRYTRHPLDTNEIIKHIESGKRPTRLALTWDDRVSFVLTDRMEIKRLAFLDIIKEEAEAHAETASEQFDADITIMAGELRRMITSVIGALGGMVEPEGDLLTGIDESATSFGNMLRENGATATLETGGNVIATFGDGPDPLYHQAVSIVRAERRASISLVQRHLRIGYNRAARLIELMEKENIVSQMSSNGSRSVYP